MINKKEIGEILKKALNHGAEFAELFWERKETTAIVCEDGKIDRINTGIDEGIGIRTLYGDSAAYTYSNDLAFARLLELAETAGKAAQKESAGMREFAFYTPKAGPEFPVKISPSAISTGEKAKKMLEADQAAREIDPRVGQVTMSYADVRQKVTIANTDDVFVEDLRTRTRLSVNAIAKEGSLVQTGYHSVGGVKGFELLDENDPAEIGRIAARRAVLMLGAESAPSGRMPVVMAGKAGGTMVHEACGHSLEADLAQKGLSVYAGKKGQTVASPLITVIDDGTMSGQFGSLRYDDEGQPAQKTVLIEKGILKNYMYDLQTARRDKTASTGNGRRESYHDRPQPRMRNTYIASGSTEPEKIIRGMKEGLLVTAMGGGQVNTTNGDYVFDVAEGYLIKDGKAGRPVRGATLTGNGPETLNMIEDVGSDQGFTIGICGKNGQGVPVSDAQPTMAIKELIVGGIRRL